MQLAIVCGNVVATLKEPKIAGRKLLIIQPLDMELKPKGVQLVAIDAVGVGDGELILFASGSSARQTKATEGTPCDCVIMAVVDQVEYKGNLIFEKSKTVMGGA